MSENKFTIQAVFLMPFGFGAGLMCAGQDNWMSKLRIHIGHSEYPGPVQEFQGGHEGHGRRCPSVWPCVPPKNGMT